MIIPLLIVFFAGELVWREREAGLGEITDATPVPEWVLFLGKFLGLGLVLVVFMALLMTAGMLAQVMHGLSRLRDRAVPEVLFGLQLPEYLLFALLALVVHVLVNQKYVGHLVALIAYVFIALASMLGIEHNLLVYGAGPGWSYTDMRGFGAVARAVAVVQALLGRVGAAARGGGEAALGARQGERPRRAAPAGAPSLHASDGRAAAAAVGLILTLGGFIFYNTNVLNEYLTASDIDGAARRVRAALRTVRRVSRSPG